MEKCYLTVCNRKARWIVAPLIDDLSGIGYPACTEHFDMVIDLVCGLHGVTKVVMSKYMVIAEQNVLAKKPAAELADLERKHDRLTDLLMECVRRLTALEEQDKLVTELGIARHKEQHSRFDAVLVAILEALSQERMRIKDLEELLPAVRALEVQATAQGLHGWQVTHAESEMLKTQRKLKEQLEALTRREAINGARLDIQGCDLAKLADKITVLEEHNERGAFRAMRKQVEAIEEDIAPHRINSRRNLACRIDALEKRNELEDKIALQRVIVEELAEH